MKYPFVIQSFDRHKNQDFSKPVTEVVVYDELERNNIVSIFDNGQNWIRTRKPKLVELTRFNWFEKLSYALPFKTQASDIIVETIKIGIGVIGGYFLNSAT